MKPELDGHTVAAAAQLFITSKKRAASRKDHQDGVAFCCFLSMSFLLHDHSSIIVIWMMPSTIIGTIVY
jgi:hypothetical protein